jgi:hypothetical protein
VSRRLKIGLLVAGVLVFLVVSAGLARVLTAGDAERAQINLVVTAEARGDAAAVIRAIDGCAARPACVARARANAAALRRPGRPKLLRLDPTTRIVIGDARGTTRVAWNPGKGFPIVQCFYIHRTGNVISGMGVSVTGVSLRIRSVGLCKGMKSGI